VCHALPVLRFAVRYEFEGGPINSWEVKERNFPTNKCGLCQKGWHAADLLASPERLLTPLLRDRPGGALRPAGWEEALSRIAGRVKATQHFSARRSFSPMLAASVPACWRWRR